MAASSVITAFGTSPSTLTELIPSNVIVEALPIHDAQRLNVPENTALFTREEQIRQGDTAESLLKRIGADTDSTLEQLRQAPEASIFFRQITPGKTVVAGVDKDGALQTLTFPPNGKPDTTIFIQRKQAGFKAYELITQQEQQTAMKTAEIRYSLFAAADAAGIPEMIANQLAGIFSGDIDFHRDLRKGDHFSVIYESFTQQGKPQRVGRILATEFINNGKTYRALWFGDANGKGGYYTPDGKSFRTAFLRTPLEFSRVTSGFSSARLHPILQTWRAHKGVDYGAPIGTRVKATGDGVVDFVGNQGGYGKVVILKHQGRYSTVYGHLSKFASGLKTGMRVNQGDVIAFTGMTGLASGPHLHYEFRIDGQHQNPLTVALPARLPLPPAQWSNFMKQASLKMEQIAMIRGGNIAALD